MEGRPVRSWLVFVVSRFSHPRTLLLCFLPFIPCSFIPSFFNLHLLIRKVLFRRRVLHTGWLRAARGAGGHVTRPRLLSFYHHSSWSVPLCPAALPTADQHKVGPSAKLS